MMLWFGSDYVTSVPKLTNDLRVMLSKAVRKAAFEVQLLAQDVVQVDTGAAKNSIYVALPNSSTYATASKRAAAAVAKAKRKPRRMLPEVRSRTDMTAAIAVGMEYGYDLEHGTRKSRAYPYLGPAVQKVGPVFSDAIARAVKQAAFAAQLNKVNT